MMEHWKNREIQTRADVAALLLDMIRPLKSHYSPGKSWLLVGNSGVHYGEKAARMEGFARVLWGLGPLWAADNSQLPEELKKEINEWNSLYLEGMIHGTDPENPEYWGDLKDFDQKMVEMAALAIGVSIAPKALWEPLTESQKDLFCQWMDQINHLGVHPNNWRFFRILVNMMFRLLGRPWSEERLKEDFQIIENCYEGDGWYHDGNSGQLDYYIPFAIHFYGLLYSKLMENEEPERCAVLKERGNQFVKDFLYWFNSDGEEIPFGRSLTYRFAHGAFFSALAFAGSKQLPYGVLRHMAVKNLESWMKRPIFDNEGVLSIGYGYPNLFMSEKYNGCGSPYWGFKTFFMLAMDEKHPFWSDEDCIPDLEDRKLLEHPHMLMVHNDKHVQAFVAGQHCMNHGCVSEKYEKFVYSNQFGFSVSRGHSLQDGAFDSTLAVSLSGDNHYRMKYGTQKFQVTEQAVFLNYDIMPGVFVKSAIIPLGPWHVRLHQITTDKALDIADGGFSIEAERRFSVPEGRSSGKYTGEDIEKEPGKVFACLPWGVSGAVALNGGTELLVDTFPNTNLLYNLAVLPTITKEIQPGIHMFINCFLGDRTEVALSYKEDIPEVTLMDDMICIKTRNKNISIEWPNLKQEE